MTKPPHQEFSMRKLCLVGLIKNSPRPVRRRQSCNATASNIAYARPAGHAHAATPAFLNLCFVSSTPSQCSGSPALSCPTEPDRCLVRRSRPCDACGYFKHRPARGSTPTRRRTPDNPLPTNNLPQNSISSTCSTTGTTRGPRAAYDVFVPSCPSLEPFSASVPVNSRRCRAASAGVAPLLLLLLLLLCGPGAFSAKATSRRVSCGSPEARETGGGLFCPTLL
ncbi:uncharacterized protein J3D65DRAFT_476048 [Phyllosticta citribraziliensis]|uniref:Uncharacterized protein n=1 Tax=Phyllosticta citribraziliensis TaxID=989973 RepID=A0ABR1LHV1_9PEZI